MDMRKEKNSWQSVPQFGGWDSAAANYSMVFSQARANRKQKKTYIKPVKLGSNEEFVPAVAGHSKFMPATARHDAKEYTAARVRHDNQYKRKNKIWSYISCCFRP